MIKIGRRKIAENIIGDLKIEFIKINCDLDSTFRCLKCIREQDISILLDGRVKICTGLINNRQNSYFLKLLEENPLLGISNLIRKKYAFIGFFYNLYFLVNSSSSVFSDKYDEDKITEFRQYLNTKNFNFDPHRDFTSQLANFIISESNSFRKTFNEDKFTYNEFEVSFKTLEFLVSELFNPNIELNKQLKILILISYFSVDFDVFDNPKTRLVQNLLPSLLLLIEKEDDTDFIELSLFYLIIIGIGVSNCSPSLFNSIIENFTSTIATPSLLHYIKGLILREESKKSRK